MQGKPLVEPWGHWGDVRGKLEMKNTSAEVSWVDRVHKRFKETGRLIPKGQEKLYKKIRNEWVRGKTIIDVGTSLGIGANILAQEARFVWGVDINSEAINFAKKAFQRPNLDFEVMDIEKPPTRSIAQFEVVVMIETLEHLENPELALNNLKRFFLPETIGFITIPDSANPEVLENEKKHGFHLHSWNGGQFYELMTKHFKHVVMYSVDKLKQWQMDETVDGTTKDYLIVAKLESPK